MNVVRQGLKSLLTACLPRERWLVHGRRARGVDGMAISLTFDDGPHPEITPQVLDRLELFGWKGTFFVVGEKAAASPELIRRIVRDGHELGNHTYSHAEPSQTTAAAFLDEVRQTRRLLEDLAGRPVTFVRPPKGELTWSKLLGLWREQQTVAMWNVDPKDYRLGCEVELCRWAAGYSPSWGDIVLLHDAYPQVLHILDTLQEQRRLVGAETVSLSRWLPAGGPSPVGTANRNQHPLESEELPCP